MCGIAGFVIPPGYGLNDAQGAVKAMTGSIRHRGPDDCGQWFDPQTGVALGHRRLSILDLSQAGHQPMWSASGRYVTVFNGEIYNHLELRKTLKAEDRDANWRGHSDTETLLAAIDAWGMKKAFQRCVGMFAAVVWDRETRSLTLVRDRIGEKPLYYGFWNGVFLFSSELKSMRAFPGFAPRIDRDALGLYMAFNYVPAPRSIYEGIHKLPPGGMVTLPTGKGLSPGAMQAESYWSLSAAMAGKKFAGSPEDAVGELEHLLSRAVRLQMISDVPLGCFLSGGIDSSVVTALMQAQSTQPVRTFAIGFGEETFNEARHAALVAQHLGTDHTELIVTASDALELVPRIPEIWDEPFADSSQIPTALVSALARRKVTVCLSGDGGDELFGGYNHYALSQSLEKVPAKSLVAALLRAAPLSLIARLCAAMPGLGTITERRLRNVEQVLGTRGRLERYLMMMAQWKDTAHFVPGSSINPAQASGFRPPPGIDDLNAISAMDTMTYLPDDILVKVDRAAMASSLETRVPLLDHRVVEFAFSLPASYKLRDGRTKWPLRQVLAKHVPQELTDRPKQGFAVPIGTWLRGPLRDWALDLLAPAAVERSGLNPKPVTALWNQHQAGTPYLENRLWGILMYQAWFARNCGG